MMYELYVMRQQRWQLDTVYDDKELAIADARSVMAGNSSPTAVQVVETGAESRIVFKKKRGGFATLGEVRVLKDHQARMKERRDRRRRKAEADAERQRRMRRRKLVATALLLIAAILSGSMWLYR